MHIRRFSLIALGIAATFGMAASPALAQGKGKVRNDDRPNLERRADDTRRSADTSGEWESRAGSGNGAGTVPPGWCQGRGNPHNTVENCGYGAQSIHASSRDRSGSPTATYDEAHDRFHEMLNAKYRDLAAQRPLDAEYQIRLQMQKREEHERWHRSMRVAHE